MKIRAKANDQMIRMSGGAAFPLKPLLDGEPSTATTSVIRFAGGLLVFMAFVLFVVRWNKINGKAGAALVFQDSPDYAAGRRRTGDRRCRSGSGRQGPAERRHLRSLVAHEFRFALEI